MNNFVPVSAPKIPRELAWLFQTPPVLSSEQKTIYDSVVASVSTAVQPEDGIVWTLVKEVVELTLEIHQYRSFRADVINMTRKEALANMLASLLGGGDIPAGSDRTQRAQEMAEEWFADPGRSLAIKKIFHRHDLTPRAIDAQAAVLRLGDIVVFDKMIADADRRRNQIFQVIELYRDGLGAQVQKATAQIIEGKAQEISLVPDTEQEKG